MNKYVGYLLISYDYKRVLGIDIKLYRLILKFDIINVNFMLNILNGWILYIFFKEFKCYWEKEGVFFFYVMIELKR